ncbi:chemotaxis protein CheY [Geobacter sp. OR-1]|uniref:response regulator transcription factor n=1 Tax=Geobacter sp. OR-1 TaxID=1266765 RepID=UPI0005434473|nr:response regulator [Geobacter sp. OR-1]GAM10216.1 chemotaxis protein CheY [Geobacter sp. OR-1]
MARHDSSPSILLVEDDKVTIELLSSMLTLKYPEISLHTATSGRMGLELFKTHQPDIVITDINMPEMSGLEMVGEIRAIRPDTRFIILTGNSGKAFLQHTGESGVGFEFVIVKPVVFLELFTIIEKCFAEISC